MVAGRKPVPTQLKILRGNPGKRAIPHDVPSPAVESPEVPRHIRGVARKEWRRIVDELVALGVLARVDRAMLELYCQDYAEYRHAQMMIALNGYVVESEKGGLYQSPWVGIKNQAQMRMMRFLTEFGGTASSRARVRIEKPREELTMAEKLRAAIGGDSGHD